MIFHASWYQPKLCQMQICRSFSHRHVLFLLMPKQILEGNSSHTVSGVGHQSRTKPSDGSVWLYGRGGGANDRTTTRLILFLPSSWTSDSVQLEGGLPSHSRTMAGKYIMSSLKLEKIRYWLQQSNRKFKKVWGPFLNASRPCKSLIIGCSELLCRELWQWLGTDYFIGCCSCIYLKKYFSLCVFSVTLLFVVHSI